MNVFLIETPHQLINAVEAREFFNLRDNYLIVIIKEEYTTDSYGRLIEPNDWKSVCYLSLKSDPMSGFLRKLSDSRIDRIRGYYNTYELKLLRKALDRVSESLGKVERLFIGNYWIDYMRHFANCTPHREVYLLDDGTTTLAINKSRKESGINKKSINRDKLKKGLINKTIGLRDRHLNEVTFFTIYDLETRPSDRSVKHDYQYLRKKASVKQSNNVVYFIGMTLVDEGIAQEKYLDYLAGVKHYFANEKFFYIQHWEEPPGRLEKIRNNLDP